MWGDWKTSKSASCETQIIETTEITKRPMKTCFPVFLIYSLFLEVKEHVVKNLIGSFFLTSLSLGLEKISRTLCLHRECRKNLKLHLFGIFNY